MLSLLSVLLLRLNGLERDESLNDHVARSETLLAVLQGDGGTFVHGGAARSAVQAKASGHENGSWQLAKPRCEVQNPLTIHAATAGQVRAADSWQH